MTLANRPWTDARRLFLKVDSLGLTESEKLTRQEIHPRQLRIPSPYPLRSRFCTVWRRVCPACCSTALCAVVYGTGYTFVSVASTSVETIAGCSSRHAWLLTWSVGRCVLILLVAMRCPAPTNSVRWRLEQLTLRVVGDHSMIVLAAQRLLHIIAWV